MTSLFCALLLSFNSGLVVSAEIVTVDNFVRAETDTTMQKYVSQGALGKFVHNRKPTSPDEQHVIRMSRDMLYSAGVFDLTQPAVITMPDAGGRFQSIQVINQDHYTKVIGYGPNLYRLSMDELGTRYVFVIIRTFIDASNPADIKVANALQDEISVRQSSAGSFEVPDWDTKSLGVIRGALNMLASTRADTSRNYGDKDEVNPVDHLLGTAFGWGGSPREAAIYVNVVPARNDGMTPYVLTVKDVPVDGFWSVTVYNSEGFMEKNDQDSYAFNNVTAEPNVDGSITVHFGGDPGQVNFLPIFKGWNYNVRMFRPRKDVIDGVWTFPDAVPLK